MPLINHLYEKSKKSLTKNKSKMKHLPIPFEQRAEIIIQKGSDALCKFHTEIATSPIEHFQALLYRNEARKGFFGYIYF
jgi:hypothetical protein